MGLIFASLNLNDSVKNESSFSKCLTLSRSKMMVDARQGFLIGTAAVILFLIFIGDGFYFCFIEFERLCEK